MTTSILNVGTLSTVVCRCVTVMCDTYVLGVPSRSAGPGGV